MTEIELIEVLVRSLKDMSVYDRPDAALGVVIIPGRQLAF